MVQNVILSARNKSLAIAGNNSSEFVKRLAERLEKTDELSSGGVKAIMNIFDSSEHEGIIFRGDLLEWLWENQGERISLAVK